MVSRSSLLARPAGAGLSLLFGSSLLLSAAPAAAQQEGEISAQRFQPAPGPNNFLGVAGARTERQWSWSAGLMFDYARDPLVVHRCTTGTDCSAPDATQAEARSVVPRRSE